MAAHCDVTSGQRTISRLCLISLFVLSLQFCCTRAARCTTYNTRRQETDYFDCPLRGDDWDEKYCCGTSMRQKCCDYEDYLEENPNLSGAIIAVIVIVTLLMLGCLLLAICCCCSCCYLAQRRQRRGVVLRTSGATTSVLTTTTTTANQPTGYPRQEFYQPVAPMYPTSAAPHYTNTMPTPYQNTTPANVYIPQPQPPQEYEKPPPYYSN